MKVLISVNYDKEKRARRKKRYDRFMERVKSGRFPKKTKGENHHRKAFK